MSGWIKLHRRMLESSMYKQLNSKQRDVMLTVLMMTNHKAKEWEYGGIVYKANPGQFVCSLDSIKQNCASDVSIQNIRTTLLKLEKHGFLTNESTNRNRLITIVNWAVYQKSDDELTGELTDNQQATNKQLTTNKNVKKDKNDKEEKIKPSPSQNSNKYSEDDGYYQMSLYLFNKIKTAKTDVNPNLIVKEPNFQKWSNDFRLIVEKDNRDKSELKRLIDWIYTDSFWKSNIESPATLREKYERLVVKMDSKPASNNRGLSRKDEFHEMLDNMMRMEDDPTVIDITGDAFEVQKNISRGELF